MAKFKLRQAIAAEAARLMLRREETEYMAARKRAARWLSRRRVAPHDLPSDAEIQSHLYSLAGLFTEEQQQTGLFEIRTAARELMEVLADFEPRVMGCVVNGPVKAGSDIQIDVVADSPETVAEALSQAGFHPRLISTDTNTPVPQIEFSHYFPCEVRVSSREWSGVHSTGDDRYVAEPWRAGIGLEELRELLNRDVPIEEEWADDDDRAVSEHEYHPDAFSVMRMLLSRLENVQLDRTRHPEGDALYHSLQVYELGLTEHRYDEEFLLACLLHDVGLGIDRRKPLRAALQALKDIVSERTLFLIEHRQQARDFLRTGRISRSLRRSEHFDDLVCLARCDLEGRIPGAEVGSIDDALDYISGLSTAWDDV